MLEGALVLWAAAAAILCGARPGAARYRLATGATVGGGLLLLRALLPEPELRQPVQASLTLTLGYGHVLGAFWFGRRKLSALLPSAIPGWLGAGTALAGLVAFFSALPLAFPGDAEGAHALLFFLATQSLNYWHTAENDWLLARSYERNLRLGPVSRVWTEHLKIILPTGLLLAVSASFALGLLPRGFPLSFADFFSAAVLYHIVGFLVHFTDRAIAEHRPSLLLRIAGVHLPPAAIAIVLGTSSAPWTEPVRNLYTNAAFFLFLNGIHVAQTCMTRGLAPKRTLA